MPLYEYAIIKNEKLDKDGEISDPADIVLKPTLVLAKTNKQVEMIAAKAIPDELMDDLERVEIVIRPF